MPHTSLQMPLSSGELEALAEFARFVDQCSSAREQIRAAPSLDQVIDTANWFGFRELSTSLLLRAHHHLHCTGWVWQPPQARWRDQLFVLALINLIPRQLEGALPPVTMGTEVIDPTPRQGCP